MPLTIPEALTESELRSIGKRIFELFGGGPTAPILFQRDQRFSRPFWRVDSSSTFTLARAASGWSDGMRQYMVGYFATDRLDRNLKMDELAVRLAEDGAVWFRAFDAAWLVPTVEILPEDPLGPNLAAGTYTVSCTVVNHHDEETLASESATATLAALGRLRVYVPSWPYQNPIAKEVRVYVAQGSESRRLAGTAVQVERGWTPVDVTALPAPTGALEPSESEFRMGVLRVDSVSVNTYESTDQDGEFDGVMTLRCRREVHGPVRGGFRVYSEDEITVSLADGEAI